MNRNPCMDGCHLKEGNTFECDGVVLLMPAKRPKDVDAYREKNMIPGNISLGIILPY